MPAQNISGVDFKDQQEAREYAKRVGVEYRFGCLEEKQAQSCHLLADYVEAIEQNAKQAFGYYKENCLERSHPHSCFKYGRYLVYGKPNVCPQKFDEALGAFVKACTGNFSEGCRMKGLVLLHGTETQGPRPEEAEAAMVKACTLENRDACWTLSSMYLPDDRKPKAKDAEKKTEEDSKAPPKPKLRVDFEKALKYGLMGCELGNYQSCANVARMYELGQGTPKDKKKAEEFKQKTHDIIESVEKNFTLNMQEGIAD